MERRTIQTAKQASQLETYEFQLVFSTPEGKKVLAAIRKYSGIDKDLFNQENERSEAYALGRASLMREILIILNRKTDDGHTESDPETE